MKINQVTSRYSLLVFKEPFPRITRYLLYQMITKCIELIGFLDFRWHELIDPRARKSRNSTRFIAEAHQYGKEWNENLFLFSFLKTTTNEGQLSIKSRHQPINSSFSRQANCAHSVLKQAISKISRITRVGKQKRSWLTFNDASLQ